METKVKTLARVNQVEIIASGDKNAMVPIKPICEALGIAFQPQLQKLKEDEDLSSTITLSIIVAADGKEREMACLPLKYIFGWLFTINPKNVKPEAQEAVRRYRMECYDALYRHFTAQSEFMEHKQLKTEEQLAVVDQAKSQFRMAKNVLTDAKSQLKKIRTLTQEEYEYEKRQLEIDFADLV